MTEPDLAARLWNEATAEAARLRPESVSAATILTLVGSAELIANRRRPEFSRIANAISGNTHPMIPPESAVAANGYLIHASLADDAYRLAHHPGLTVLPSCLAGALERRLTGAETVRLIITGYELACRLADLFLPDASKRGWRLTALVAPMTAAALYTAAHDSDLVPDALRLAVALVGGTLHTVAGDDWRLQPALHGAGGILSARAVLGGARGNRGALESSLGPVPATTGHPARADADIPRLGAVMWKRYDVAMYGQAIFDAIHALAEPIPKQCDIEVTVSPFASGYADQKSLPTDSVANLEGIVRKAVASVSEGAIADGIRVSIVADADIDELDAIVRVSRADQVWTSHGTGSTQGCDYAAAIAHVQRKLGDDGAELADTVAQLFDAPSIDALDRAWRAL